MTTAEEQTRPPANAGAPAPSAPSGGPRPGGGPRGRSGGRGRRFYPPRRRVCAFCVEKKIVIDYKNVGMLRRYISERARISPRRRTGTCARHQRILSDAIKRARQIALLPFTPDHIRVTGWHG